LFDYSAISSEADVDYCKRLVLENGVATIPLSVFYSEALPDRVIRICFAKKEETMKMAAERLLAIGR
jgi:methionine aminotransferase